MKTLYEVEKLGNCSVPSPLHLSNHKGDNIYNYIKDDQKVLYDITLENFIRAKNEEALPIALEKAGPRERIYFDPTKTKAAIVTCGGLCPGINNVIRSLVMGLYYRYKVNNVLGIQYGYQGFIPKYNLPFIELTPKSVSNIHQFGGSILASSRGEQEVSEIVDSLERNNINILFTIGGDGTLRGAVAIANEIKARGLKISVAGIPKTIDNDINFIEKSFGFETSFTIANPIIRDAHNEAKGAWNGIAIVKLMGRDSGFIAANAALSMPEVNFVLIPEMDFDLYGEKGFFNVLKNRLERSHHALIVVAEGAGQFLFDDKHRKKDQSGNILHKDIGVYLKSEIKNYFKQENIPATVKYIDPSYIIRSAPANASDSIFCSQLALNAIHGAMTGRTTFVGGIINNQFVYLPIPLAVESRKKIDLKGELWWNVLEATGQPVNMKN
ncbi:MAG: ATP-dependent 6-phosphofructokinase [Bacteroidota bacterium]